MGCGSTNERINKPVKFKDEISNKPVEIKEETIGPKNYSYCFKEREITVAISWEIVTIQHVVLVIAEIGNIFICHLTCIIVLSSDDMVGVADGVIYCCGAVEASGNDAIMIQRESVFR